MNEENTVVNGEKPRKKKRSLWWLWFLLLLAAFTGGVVCGLKINTLPLPAEMRARLYPVLESYLPGSTTPRTPEDAMQTPAPEAALPTPSPETAPEPTQEPELLPAPVETAPAEPTPDAVPAPAETQAPEAAPADTDESAKKAIGIDAALEAALTHAELEKADVEITGVYRTKDDDGQAMYEVGFKSGDLSYDYQIGAYDGELLGWKVSGFTFSDTAVFAADFEGNDSAETAIPAPAQPEPIGEENAKSLAFRHAGVKPAEVLRASVELKPDGNVYTVEFKTASRLFTSEIDAFTGEVLSSEVTR